MVAGTLYLAAHVEMNVSTHFWAEKDLMRTASSHLVDLSTNGEEIDEPPLLMLV
jgi:hypothetical protein